MQCQDDLNKKVCKNHTFEKTREKQVIFRNTWFVQIGESLVKMKNFGSNVGFITYSGNLVLGTKLSKTILSVRDLSRDDCIEEFIKRN